MESLFTSGRFANIILAVMAVEVAVFSFYLWRRNQNLGLLSFIANTLSGASLVLALRAALIGAGWRDVALYVAASLLAHLVDLTIRFVVAKGSSGQP